MIELNGIANLKLLLDNIKASSPEQFGQELKKIDEQVDILHAYLKEVGKVVEYNQKALEAAEMSYRVVPFWHTVKGECFKNKGE